MVGCGRLSNWWGSVRFCKALFKLTALPQGSVRVCKALQDPTQLGRAPRGFTKLLDGSNMLRDGGERKGPRHV